MTRVLTHGTPYGYKVLGCRCDDCRIAAREQHARWQQSVAGNPPAHGTTNGYNNYGCRCEACTAANTEYARDYNLRDYRAR